MKKYLLLFLLALMSYSAFSQVTISKEEYDRLSDEVKTEIKVASTKDEVLEASKYVTLGKEIGVAVNETLKAVEDSAVRISRTELGKTAIVIIVWKLLYKDLAGLVLGIIFIGLSVYFIIRSVNRLCSGIDDVAASASLIIGAVLFLGGLLTIFK